MKELKFEKPKTSIEEFKGNYGRFVVTPLERGFGTTLGNALRRILLSSLPGAAFVNVKIDGAEHEFQNVDGVVEDTITMILNLKRVVLTVDSDDPNYEAVVEIDKGEGEVCAGDIILNSDIKVCNPEQHIATVAAGGRLHMFLTIKHVSAEDALRKHTLDSVTEHFLISVWTLHHLSISCLVLTAWIARESDVHLLILLCTSNLNLVGIDNDYIVATVHVGCEDGFVLTAKYLCYFGCETTQGLSCCIHYHPLLFCCFRGDVACLETV